MKCATLAQLYVTLKDCQKAMYECLGHFKCMSVSAYLYIARMKGLCKSENMHVQMHLAIF